MPFSFTRTAIPDVIVVAPRVFPDGRGSFAELYKASEFRENGIRADFIQMNYSCSQQGVLRGLHYQLAPRAQAKLVTVLHGEIFDVAVDIRQGSPTYGRWVSVVLSGTNKKMLFIPEGFAHGFFALEDDTEILYQCSQEYVPECERSILWNDPTVGVVWPIADPQLSPKDLKALPLAGAENNFHYAG